MMPKCIPTSIPTPRSTLDVPKWRRNGRFWSPFGRPLRPAEKNEEKWGPGPVPEKTWNLDEKSMWKWEGWKGENKRFAWYFLQNMRFWPFSIFHDFWSPKSHEKSIKSDPLVAWGWDFWAFGRILWLAEFDDFLMIFWSAKSRSKIEIFAENEISKTKSGEGRRRRRCS